MNTYLILAVTSFLLLQGCAHPRIINVNTVDIKGKSISNVQLNLLSYIGDISFDVSGKQGVSSTKVSDKSAATNEDGKHTFLGLFGSSVTILATKEGFYSTRVTTEENTIKIPLRPKINPITVVKKDIFINFPSSEGTFGFDILAGDLVKPYGRGDYSDFEIKIAPYSFEWRGDLVNTTRGTMKVTDKSGGFIPHIQRRVFSPTSENNLVYTAPEYGYQNKALHDINRDIKDDINISNSWYWTDDFIESYRGGNFATFFFKVRSTLDGGPIYGMITLFHGIGHRNNGKPYISFRYFANPDGTNNLEVGKEILYLE